MTAQEFLDGCRGQVLEAIELRRRAGAGGKGNQALKKRLAALERLRDESRPPALAILSACGMAPMEMQVMELYYLEGLTLREIARELRYSYGYIRCVRRDAGERLRRVRDVAVFTRQG